MGKLKDKIKDNVNEAAGKLKQESGNPDTRHEGRKQDVKGKAQQFRGDVKGKLGDDI